MRFVDEEVEAIRVSPFVGSFHGFGVFALPPMAARAQGGHAALPGTQGPRGRVEVSL